MMYVISATVLMISNVNCSTTKNTGKSVNFTLPPINETSQPAANSSTNNQQPTALPINTRPQDENCNSDSNTAPNNETREAVVQDTTPTVELRPVTFGVPEDCETVLVMINLTPIDKKDTATNNVVTNKFVVVNEKGVLDKIMSWYKENCMVILTSILIIAVAVSIFVVIDNNVRSRKEVNDI